MVKATNEGKLGQMGRKITLHSNVPLHKCLMIRQPHEEEAFSSLMILSKESLECHIFNQKPLNCRGGVGWDLKSTLGFGSFQFLGLEKPSEESITYIQHMAFFRHER